MFRFRALAALALATAVCLAAPARADHLPIGTFLGPGAGDNDTEALIESIFGFAPGSIMMIARILGPDGLPIEGTEVDGLSYDNFVLNDDDEPAGGDWFYDGPEVVDLVAVKAGPNWGVWQFTDGLNQGGFNTLDLQPGNDPGDQRGFGDVTVYKIVPEPSSLALVGVGALALALRVRRRTA
jgi:hypothetical protein